MLFVSCPCMPWRISATTPRIAAPMQSSLSIRHYNKAGIYRKRSRFAPRLAMPRLKTAWLEEVLFEIPLWGADKCQGTIHKRRRRTEGGRGFAPKPIQADKGRGAILTETTSARRDAVRRDATAQCVGTNRKKVGCAHF